MGVFDQGRNFIYKGVIGLILMNPVSAMRPENRTFAQDEQWEAHVADILKGLDLVRSESANAIHDPLCQADVRSLY